MYKKPCRLTVKAIVLKGETSKATLIHNSVFDLESEYKKWSDKIPAPDARVKFISDEIPVDELNELYSESDIGLYMTSGEGFGMAPLEGAAFGMP